jgi:hypothetical protein
LEREADELEEGNNNGEDSCGSGSTTPSRPGSSAPSGSSTPSGSLAPSGPSEGGPSLQGGPSNRSIWWFIIRIRWYSR